MSDTPAEKSRGLSQRNYILLLLALVVVIDAAAMMFAPPYDPQSEAGAECVYPVCFINGNLELPAPHVVWPEDYSNTSLITFEPSITSTMITMWGVTIITLLTIILMARGRAMIPGRAQNAIEYVWELLEGFAMSLGGPGAKPTSRCSRASSCSSCSATGAACSHSSAR